jgi:predicted MFS family arabinose efflux permease
VTTPPPDTPRAENPWRTRLAVLTLAHVTGTLHITTLTVMAPVIKDDLSLSYAQVGLLVTAYSVGQVTASIPAGTLSDRVGVGWALVVAHLFMVAGALLLTQADGAAIAMAAMLMTGWGYAIVNPATAKGVFDSFPPERRATAMGIKQTGVPIGGVTAAAIGSFATAGGWPLITTGVAIATIAGGLCCLAIVERPKPRPSGAAAARSGTLRDVIRDMNFGRFVLANFLYNFGQASFFAYLTLFIRQSAQASQEVAGLCYGVAQIFSVAARLGWGAVSDFLFKGQRKALTVSLGLAAAVFLAAMTQVAPGWGLTLGIGLSAALGLTIASYAPLMQTMSTEAVPRHLTGSAVGYNMVGTSMGSIVGPPVFGAAIDYTGAFESGWLLCSVLVAAGVALLAFGFRERGTTKE